MNVIDLPVSAIIAAEWNSNEMDEGMRTHLKASIRRYGLTTPLVVRLIGDHSYETVGGAQRLAVATEMGFISVPCVVVEADDAEARLLSQALNHVAGQDNLGLRAELIRHLLSELSEEEVLAVLPDSAVSLNALASLGEGDIAEQLAAWERAQLAKLRHLQFQLTDDQLGLVDEALEKALAATMTDGTSPNKRGTALATICRNFIETSAGEAS